MGYDFVEVMEKAKKIFNSRDTFCDGISCKECEYIFKDILLKGNYCVEDAMMIHPQEFAEFVMNYETPVDWSKVAVDTPILVRDEENDRWLRRHFAKYENNLFFAFGDGKTSFTTDGNIYKWYCAKLYEPERGGENETN